MPNRRRELWRRSSALENSSGLVKRQCYVRSECIPVDSSVGRRSAAFGSEAGECGMGAKEPPLVEGLTQRDEEATVDVFEVSGSIKWFDASKGYGFIVPDEDSSRHSPACDVPAPRRLSDRLRGRARGLRGVAPAERLAGLPHPRHGRFDGRSIRRNCRSGPMSRGPGERLGAGHGQVVQPPARLRLPDPRRRRASTFSCTWRRSGAAASPSSGPARPCWCAMARGPKGLMAAELKPDGSPGPSSH